MAKMFRKTGLPRVTVKDPNVKQWALRLSKTLDDLSSEQGRQFATYIGDQITENYNTVTNEYEEYVTNNYGIILTGETGSIFYVYNGVVTELPHGIYGQVLVTGGHGKRPFWDWVWNAPGASTATAFVIDVEVFSSVANQKVTMDYTKALTGAITSDFVSSEGPQPQLFEAWDFSVTASDTEQKVTMDHSVNLVDTLAYGAEAYGARRYGGSSSLLTEIITSVA